MLIWRAGAAPPPGRGNATSVSAAIRFQLVTSLGVAAETACTPTVAIGASALSTTIEVSAAAETNRLRVFIDVSLVAPVLDPGRSHQRLARAGKRSPFDFRRIFRWPFDPRAATAVPLCSPRARTRT